jgi:hypothetical protein
MPHLCSGFLFTHGSQGLFAPTGACTKNLSVASLQMNVGELEGTEETALVGTIDNEGFEDGNSVGDFEGCGERVGETLGSLSQDSHVKGQ